jgi:2-polyprenyl-6-hydroxyphenyl methylase/3-demethylubiquinone-9 3-methyltransferase
MTIDPEQVRAGQRAMWSTGDWPSIAKTIQPVADALIERAGVRTGQDVLDVGTGSGNVAVPAAGRGARVTGADITPELMDMGRERAAAEGVEVEWVEGDAGALPFADESFDVVLSVFGCMFAPDHQAAANELVRVCRPGGTIGVCAWTPEGLNGRLLKLAASAMPPPPPEVKSPILWGEEGHVRELFDGTGVDLVIEEDAVSWDWPSADGWVSFTEQNLGPTVMAKSALEPAGEWAPMRERLVTLYSEFETPDGFRPRAEYLRTIARRPG